MSSHNRSTCCCPSCETFRNMLDQLREPDFKPKVDPFAGLLAKAPLASIALEFTEPTLAPLTQAIHDSIPVPLPEFARKQMHLPEQNIQQICNITTPQPARTMTANDYARYLLNIRLMNVRTAVTSLSNDHEGKNLDSLTDLVGQLESRVAEMFP